MRKGTIVSQKAAYPYLLITPAVLFILLFWHIQLPGFFI